MQEKESVVVGENGDVTDVQHMDNEKLTPLSGSIAPQKGAVNALLILACISFGSASFLFGYDDKVISPVAALTAFVSVYCLSSGDKLLFPTQEPNDFIEGVN